MLSDRKKKILQVVIDDYITSASPVSSKSIHETHLESLSPATIRSELKSLEELGFLTHPHTSAGRVPTQLAYKHYIENVVKESKMTERELKEVRKYFSENIKEAEYIASSCVKVLSELTNYTSLATLSKKKEFISGVRLMKISDSVIVLIIVLQSGKVNDYRIYGNFVYGEEYVKTAEHILSKHIAGKAIGDMASLEENIFVEFTLYGQLFESIFEALSFEVKRQDKLLLMGESKIFEHPEYNNIDNVKKFISTIDSKDKLYEIISESPQNAISVNFELGGEGASLPDQCSLVTCSYKIDDIDFGTYGVIGPVRMDYNKVIKVLNGIRDILSDIVEGKEKK